MPRFSQLSWWEANGCLPLATKSYGPNAAGTFRAAARHIDKILKGAKPGDIPVEQPTVIDLTINLTAAKALGLTVPKSILLRADRVIE